MTTPDKNALDQAESQPSASVVDGRDVHGRFTPGNKAAKGNPHASQVAKLRSAALQAVTEDKIERIIAKLVELAEEGNVQAAKEVLDRCLGKPQELDLIERVEQLEQQLDQALEARGAS